MRRLALLSSYLSIDLILNTHPLWNPATAADVREIQRIAMVYAWEQGPGAGARRARLRYRPSPASLSGMFHIELHKFPHSAWRFNLSEGELRAILVPWVREEWTEVGERKWSPHETKMTILEGPKLEPQDISMGRGWRNAQRRSEDITDKTLSAFSQAEQERASAIDNARIEEAARVQVAAREGSAASPPMASAAAVDPLTLGMQLAALLGPRPTELLAAWQQAAAEAPERTPSDALAVAERALLESSKTAG